MVPPADGVDEEEKKADGMGMGDDAAVTGGDADSTDEADSAPAGEEAA